MTCEGEGKVYKGQTAAEIVVTVCQDITGALSKKIKFKKPDGSTGDFPGTIVDALTGVIKYKIASENDLDQIGVWTFWGYIQFADSDDANGEPEERTIYAEGT